MFVLEYIESSLEFLEEILLSYFYMCFKLERNLTFFPPFFVYIVSCFGIIN